MPQHAFCPIIMSGQSKRTLALGGLWVGASLQPRSCGFPPPGLFPRPWDLSLASPPRACPPTAHKGAFPVPTPGPTASWGWGEQ